MIREPRLVGYGAPLVLTICCAAAVSAAQEQAPRYQPGWPCAARPDPSHTRVAEGSGGQIFLFHPSEVGESAPLMIGAMQHPQTVARVVATLDEGLHEFAFPIDSSIESAFFTVSLQCLQVVEIVRPSGELVRDSDPGIAYSVFQAGHLATVPRPDPGTWRVRVGGRGMFFLAVQAKTAMALGSVAFVRRGGEPGDLLPAGQVPRGGGIERVRVDVRGPGRDFRIRLVTDAGDDLLVVTPSQHGTSGEQQLIAAVVPPHVPFRVGVTGVDAAGLPFQRVHAPLFDAFSTRTAVPPQPSTEKPVNRQHP